MMTCKNARNEHFKADRSPEYTHMHTHTQNHNLIMLSHSVFGYYYINIPLKWKPIQRKAFI